LEEEDEGVEDEHEDYAPAEAPPAREEKEHKKEAHEELKDVRTVARNQPQHGHREEGDRKTHEDVPALEVLGGRWLLCRWTANLTHYDYIIPPFEAI
jgi:hypothetical protein